MGSWKDSDGQLESQIDILSLLLNRALDEDRFMVALGPLGGVYIEVFTSASTSKGVDIFILNAFQTAFRNYFLISTTNIQFFYVLF